MNKFIFIFISLSLFLFHLTIVWRQTVMRGTGNVPFNDNWLFYKGDQEGAEMPNFDDHDWRQLDLPHDWAIEGPLTGNTMPGTGTAISRHRMVQKTFHFTCRCKK